MLAGGEDRPGRQLVVGPEEQVRRPLLQQGRHGCQAVLDEPPVGPHHPGPGQPLQEGPAARPQGPRAGKVDRAACPLQVRGRQDGPDPDLLVHAQAHGPRGGDGRLAGTYPRDRHLGLEQDPAGGVVEVLRTAHRPGQVDVAQGVHQGLARILVHGDRQHEVAQGPGPVHRANEDLVDHRQAQRVGAVGDDDGHHPAALVAQRAGRGPWDVADLGGRGPHALGRRRGEPQPLRVPVHHVRHGRQRDPRQAGHVRPGRTSHQTSPAPDQ